MVVQALYTVQASGMFYCTLDAEYTGTIWKTWQNILEGYGNRPELDGKVWKLAEATGIIQNSGSVDPYSYPCRHT